MALTHATEPVSALTCALFYIALRLLSISFFFLGFRQWRSRVFGMFEIMIRAHTVAYRPNTCLFQYVPILTPIHSPIQFQYNQMQTYTSSNTDQNKHHYRPMHASSFSILAPVHANTGIDTVKSGAPRALLHRQRIPRPRLQVCQRYLSQDEPHPLVHSQKVPRCFMTAKLSTLESCVF